MQQELQQLLLLGLQPNSELAWFIKIKMKSLIFTLGLVNAAGLIVDVEVQSDNSYYGLRYGPLYIGSNFEQGHLIYDTLSSWTTMNVASAKGAKMTSDYDPL